MAKVRNRARTADRFNAPWYAVYVQTPSERVEKTDAATHRIVTDSLTTATQLGGVSMQFRGSTFEAAVAAFVTALERLILTVPQPSCI